MTECLTFFFLSFPSKFESCEVRSRTGKRNTLYLESCFRRIQSIFSSRLKYVKSHLIRAELRTNRSGQPKKITTCLINRNSFLHPTFFELSLPKFPNHSLNPRKWWPASHQKKSRTMGTLNDCRTTLARCNGIRRA